MRIAVIGTGSVGSILGRGWSVKGHEVTFCSRDPEGERVQAVVERAGGCARSARTPEGAAAAEVIVLAVPWSAAEQTVRQAGELMSKVVVDATNPVRPDLSGLMTGPGQSAAEKIAVWSGGAHVVKAFNTIHASTMADTVFGGVRADLFLAGDNPKAKTMVSALGRDLGFEIVDVGPLRAASMLESLAMLWIHLAFRQAWGTDFAFKILRR